MRRPLGISIVGGLIVSQILTLYTTPVIYLYIQGYFWRSGKTRYPSGPALDPLQAGV